VKRAALRAASGDLPSRLRSIMKTGPGGTAEECHQYLLDLFQAADPAEIDSLLRAPEKLTLASAYVHAVLDDLDERRPAATAELHGVLGRVAGPIIVGWPE